MAIDHKDPDDTRWRDAQEIRALRDMLGIYRRETSTLAADVTALRAEVERLRGAQRARHAAVGIRLIEIEIDLDEHAQELVGAILVTELTDLRTAELEDVLLVARELAAGGARRHPESPRAILRVERSPTSLRVELQELTSIADPAPLGIVQRLSERWGTEHLASGPCTAWAQLALADAP